MILLLFLHTKVDKSITQFKKVQAHNDVCAICLENMNKPGDNNICVT